MKRIFSIDVLRGVAVILVIFRHFHSTDYAVRIPILENIGWLGVDLFFVLSGFLISSLLYKEIEKRGNIDFKRFFVRRGFKIYPSFYFLLLFTVAVKLISYKGLLSSELLAECFFLQSYIKGMMVHSWSLGVEEHFYIVLPLLIIAYIKITGKKIRESNFINVSFIIVAVFCLLTRYYNVHNYPIEIYKNVFNTHIRMDALFFGVFLSYHYRYHQEKLKSYTVKLAPVFIIYCLIIFPTAYYFELTSAFVATIGLTLYYLGFGMVLLMTLFASDIVKPGPATVKKATFILQPIAFVGFYSYTIYLWHIVAEGVINRAGLYQKWNLIAAFTLYLIMSVVAGVLSSKIIEQPILKVRERYFK